MPKLIKFVLAAGASALAMTGAAQAQDQGRGWEGFYVGATAGASQGDAKLQSAPLYTASPSSFWGTFAGQTANSSPKLDVEGAEYGVTGGHNWQRGSWVYGIEMDGSWSDANGALTIADRPSAGTNRFTTKLNVDVDTTATLRARLGYAFGPLMVYGTAGGSAMRIDFNRSYLNAAGAQLNGSGEQAFVGTAYGAGAEYALGDHWSVKGEYLRLDVNDSDIDTYYSDGSRAAATVDLDRELVRAGVNYRF